MEIPAGLWIALILLEALLFIVFIGAAVLLFRFLSNTVHQQVIQKIEQALADLVRLEEKLQSASGTLNAINQTINQKLGGTEKGRVGEEIVREQLNSLIAVGCVEQNVSLGEGKVEFAVKLPGNYYVPLDSKFVDPKSDPEKRAKEITKYIDDPRTLGFGIMVVPDEAHRSVLSNIGKMAQKHRVVVVPYTLVESFVLSLYLIAERLALSAHPIKNRSEIGYILSQFSNSIEGLRGIHRGIKGALRNLNEQIEALEESSQELVSLLKGGERPPEVGAAQEGTAQEEAAQEEAAQEEAE
jgi:DNA anti-recombination protein RmuC